MTPCWNGSSSNWCCNNQQETSCCEDSGNSFPFNLTTLGFSSQQSHSNSTGTTETATATSYLTAETGTGNAVSCPVSNGIIIGSSVGAFFAGTLVAGLLGLYFASRRLRKQHHTAAHDTTVSYIGPEIERRAELQSNPINLAKPGQFGMGKLNEIDGRQVGSLP